MCCGGRMCMMCVCVVAVVVLIGLLFGFGVFKDVFHKAKDSIHYSSSSSSRPFLGFPPPPPGPF